MYEVEEAARVITEQADPNAKVIFGTVIDPEQVEEGELKITVVATGFDKPEVVRKGQQRYSGQVPSPASQPHVPASRPFYQFGAEPSQSAPQQQPSAPEPAPVPYTRPGSAGGQTRRDDEDLEVPTFIRRKMREQREARQRGEDQ